MRDNSAKLDLYLDNISVQILNYCIPQQKIAFGEPIILFSVSVVMKLKITACVAIVVHFLKCKRNRVFAINSDFLIPISFQPNVVDLRSVKI